MNYAIKKLENGSCIVAFETIYAIAMHKFPAICRIFVKGGTMHKEHGIVISKKNNGKAALVIVTNPGDLIQVVEHCLRPNELESRYFQVDENYDVLPFEKNSKFLTDDDIFKFLPNSKFDCWEPLELELERIIFASEWPSWFGEIIECYLRFLKKKRRIYWWHIAGNAVDDKELELIVELHPFCALELFQNRLNDEQIQRCIELSPTGAVRFAFDIMNEDQIYLAARTNAYALLCNHANQLSVKNFQHCLGLDPETALHIRKNLSEKYHAMVMIFALKNSMLESFGIVEEEVLAEIFISLIREYDVWKNSYGGNLHNIWHNVTGYGIFTFYGIYGPILDRLVNIDFPRANKTDCNLQPGNYYDSVARHIRSIYYTKLDRKKKPKI